MKLNHLIATAAVCLTVNQAATAQAFEDKFRQLNDDKFRSLNIYRTASGAPRTCLLATGSGLQN